MKFPKFHSLLQKRGLSYAISRISISSPKNVDYHMRILEFLSLLQKRGLSYAISRISISSPKNVDYHMRILEFLSLLQKRVKVLVYCLIGIHAWLKHRSSCMSYSV